MRKKVNCHVGNKMVGHLYSHENVASWIEGSHIRFMVPRSDPHTYSRVSAKVSERAVIRGGNQITKWTVLEFETLQDFIDVKNHQLGF